MLDLSRAWGGEKSRGEKLRQLRVLYFFSWREAEVFEGRGFVLIWAQVLTVAALESVFGGSGCEVAVLLRLLLVLMLIVGFELIGGCCGAEADSPAPIKTAGRGATGTGLLPMRPAVEVVVGGEGEVVVVVVVIMVFLLVLRCGNSSTGWTSCFFFCWPTTTGWSDGPSL